MAPTVPRINVVALAVLIVSAALGVAAYLATGEWVGLAALVALGLVLMQSPRIAQQWERAIVLRFGRFVGLRGGRAFSGPPNRGKDVKNGAECTRPHEHARPVAARDRRRGPVCCRLVSIPRVTP